MEDTFNEIQIREIVEIAKSLDLKFLAIFGSVARGNTHMKSDLDIAIFTQNDQNSFDIKMSVWSQLSILLGREDIEIVDMKTASPTMMYAVINDAVLIYENGENVFLKWKLYGIKIWMETAWLREWRDKAILEWANN